MAVGGTKVHGVIGFNWEGDTQIWFTRAMIDHVLLVAPRLHKNRAMSLSSW